MVPDLFFDILPKGKNLINFGNFCKTMPGNTLKSWRSYSATEIDGA